MEREKKKREKKRKKEGECFKLPVCQASDGAYVK